MRLAPLARVAADDESYLLLQDRRSNLRRRYDAAEDECESISKLLDSAHEELEALQTRRRQLEWWCSPAAIARYAACGLAGAVSFALLGRILGGVGLALLLMFVTVAVSVGSGVVLHSTCSDRLSSFMRTYFLRLETATSQLTRIRQRMAEARSRSRQCYQQLEATEAHLKDVKLARRLTVELQEAELEIEELQRNAVIDSDKHDSTGTTSRVSTKWESRTRSDPEDRVLALLRVDWRPLRGGEFEDFVRRVFEHLGFSVEMIGGSGDGGLDLILRNNGVQIGVQCKGYSKNVGYDAVQEAVAGSALHGCTKSIAITNSEFTGPALKAAKKLRRNGVVCILIGGSQLPDLIRGRMSI